MELHLSELLAGLSHALDLTEGHPAGHAERSCVLGMRIAERAGLDDRERGHLYYALLLKDAGCSVNASPIAELYGNDDALVKATRRQRDHRRASVSALHTLRHVAPGGSPRVKLGRIRALVASGSAGAAALTELRCERGAEIARGIGLSEATASAIRSLDEHWDGGGYPSGLAGEQIPVGARVACLAQTLELFLDSGGPSAAVAVAKERRGTWFDPALVDIVVAAERDCAFWADLDDPDVGALEPSSATIAVDDARLDAVADAFGRIVDAKSPFTALHSAGVAELSALLAIQLDLGEDEAGRLYRAGQLHDVGKLGVPNTILDKPGKPDADEWARIKRHPVDGWSILQRIPPLRDMAGLALTHHEKLDGSGYPYGISADQMTTADRLLAVADIAEALSADRPYRGSMPTEKVLAIIEEDRATKLDAPIVDALGTILQDWRDARASATAEAVVETARFAPADAVELRKAA